jgi:hypothetical protein
MSYSLLCEDPPQIVCPPKFRVRASAWINSTNVGDNTLGTPPPAGVRLRWTYPFFDLSPEIRASKLSTFEIQRSKAIDAAALRIPRPRAGHEPRSPTPNVFWRELVQKSDVLYSVDGDPCRSADAIYFEMPPGSPTVTITLVTTDGSSKVSGELTGGDTFYFELANVKSAVFSQQCPVKKVEGLLLSDGDLDIPFETIAVVDAQAWLANSLSVVSERLTTRAGDPYVGLDAASWHKLQDAGRAILNAQSSGDPLPVDAVNAFLTAGAVRWEAAVLMGLGFIDGEHPAAPTIDNIILGKMLANADDQVYAYRVIAGLVGHDGSKMQIPSVPCFTQASLSSQLLPVDCTSRRAPISKGVLTNLIDIGKTPTDPIVGPPEERVFCSTSWEIEAKTAIDEVIFTGPVGTDSAITGRAFQDPGEFVSGSNPLLLKFRGLVQLQQRDLQFELPYFDSDVGLELTAGDTWDRRKKLSAIPKVHPEIEYQGNCISIGAAVCDGNLGVDGRGKVSVTLDQNIPWKADPLASSGDGKITLLMRDPATTLFEADVMIGPASPNSEGDYSAEITASLRPAELALFVRGTVTVGGLTATVKAMTPLAANRTTCVFEVNVKCAGAVLYLTPTGTVAAHLREDPQSDRLWIDLATEIAVLKSGLPAQYFVDAKLPALDHSMMLYFATRLLAEFEGKTYPGLISTPFPAPYIHPAPKPPLTCFSVDQLATDYYGRALVRVVADRCPGLDGHFALRAGTAPGQDLTLKEYMDHRSDGLFGVQQAFQRLHMFEAFETLARQAEGSSFTVGLTYVRESDGRESEAELQVFDVRRVDNG